MCSIDLKFFRLASLYRSLSLYPINNIEYIDNLLSLSDNQTRNGWIFSILSWEWLTKEDWEYRLGDPDNIYDDLKIYENPKDLGKIFYNIEEMSDEDKYIYDYLNFSYAIPTPVNEYLNQIDWVPHWTINGK